MGSGHREKPPKSGFGIKEMKNNQIKQAAQPCRYGNNKHKHGRPQKNGIKGKIPTRYIENTCKKRRRHEEPPGG